jgi:Sigma-70, region 4
VQALAEVQDKLDRIVAPLHDASKIARHAVSLMVRSSLAEERMWRAIFSLPRPLPLSRIKLEAREAWERFAEGDAEPLDLFIKERIGLLRNHEGPVPDELRERVWDILDNCFAPVSFYQRGEWFFLDQEEVQAVATLLNEHWEWFPSVERAMVARGNEKKDEVLREELPGATLAVWEELQWTENPSTLLNAVSNGFRKGGGERDKLEAKGELVDAEPDQFARANVALDMFMLREELRSRLPQRQYQVVDLRLAGFTQAEIATKLDIDEGTVKTHVSRSKPVVDEILAR